MPQLRHRYIGIDAPVGSVELTELFFQYMLGTDTHI